MEVYVWRGGRAVIFIIKGSRVVSILVEVIRSPARCYKWFYIRGSRVLFLAGVEMSNRVLYYYQEIGEVCYV